MLVAAGKPARAFTETDSALAKNFSQAGFGTEHEGRLILSPLEAGYLAKMKKTSFCGLSLSDFLKMQKKADPLFPFAFSVYCKIRKTGRVIAPFHGSSKFFRVYSPGLGRNEDRPSQLVLLSPSKIPSEKEMKRYVKTAHLCRLDLIVAFGNERRVSFLKISSFRF